MLTEDRVEIESPFLDSPLLRREDFESPPGPEGLETPWAVTETPFQNDAFLAETSGNQLAESVAELLQRLHDEEFDRSLYEMAAQAQEMCLQGLTSEYLSAEQATTENERLLSQHFAPLAAEAHRMYDRMSEGLTRYDLAPMSSAEVEALLEQYAPDAAGLAPEQQAFLGGLFNKAKQAVAGAVSLARKGMAAIGRSALGPLLNKLKALVMPLLKRVIQFAMGKLPPQVQAVARTLARKVFGMSLEAGEVEPQAASALAVESAPRVQQQYDLLVAEAVISRSDTEEEAAVQFSQSLASGEDPVQRLYEARQALVEGLSRLEAGQDPQPLIQQFLPVALMALQPIIRTVIGIIGREKVVDFIAGLLAQLVSKWIGEQPAKMIATPVVSVGLGLLGFETPPDPRSYAAEVLGDTIQETVLGLAQQPLSTFESPVLTQLAVQDAFEAAAAANFPSEILRPELREASEGGGAWVVLPLKKRRKYFKKHTRVQEITIPRKLAEEVKVFGGVSLADHLDATRVVDWRQPLRARLHLYELAVGARLADVTRLERGVNGLGSYRWEAWSQLQPLTPEAATALLREPGLGKAVDGAFLAGPYLVAPGQRFYYLEFPGGRRPRPVPRPTTTATQPQPVEKARCTANRIGVIVNVPGERVVVKIRLREEDAQRVAQALKRNDIAGAVRVVRGMREALLGVLSGKTQVGLTVVTQPSGAGELMEMLAALPGAAGASLLSGAAATPAAGAVSWVLGKIGEKLFDLLWQLVENYFKNKAQEFIAAAEDPVEGVTVFITFSNLKPLAVIREVMAGNLVRAAAALVGIQIPMPSLSTAKGCV